MKNLLVIGLSFVILFVGAAGGMHLWLEKSKATAENKDPKEKDPKDDKKPKDEPKDKGGIKEPVKPKTPDKEPAKEDDPATKLAAKLEREAVRNRELRLEKRQSQLELILQDIRLEREEADKRYKDAASELKKQEDLRAEWEAQKKLDDDAKKLAGKTPFAALPPKPADLPDPNEKKNIEKMAVMFESMAPETAAKIAQQMADGGKMGTVVKVLLQMRERSAGRLIEQIPDPALAGQLLDAIGKTKRPPVVPAAAVTPFGS